MLGSVNSNFVRVCGVNFQVGSFNCHSATARVDVERVEERRASDAAPHARMGFGARPNPQLARRVVWVGLVRSASIYYYSSSRGSHTSRASDSPRLVGSTLQSSGACPAVEVEARTTATPPRTRSSERGPRAARAGHRRRRRCIALPCAARRQQSLKTTHPQLCFLSAERAGSHHACPYSAAPHASDPPRRWTRELL
jgi:hypothetical protein